MKKHNFVILVGAVTLVGCGASTPTPVPKQTPARAHRTPPPERRTAPPAHRPSSPVDVNEPDTWFARLARSRTSRAREQAAFHLYRLWEISEAKKSQSKWTLRRKVIRQKASAVVAAAFRRKVAGRILAPQVLLNLLVSLELKDRITAGLFLEVVGEAARGRAAQYGPPEQREKVLALAVKGLGNLAARGVAKKKGLAAIEGLMRHLYASKKNCTTADRFSSARISFMAALPAYRKTASARPVLQRLLVKIIRGGLPTEWLKAPRVDQDAMVTILAIRLLGEIGDGSAPVASTLVASLFGKGRGRRFFSFAATALAKLPAGPGGKHPARDALVAMLKDAPWKLSRKQIGARRKMPACPLSKSLHYVCRMFWTALTERWDRTEPGVFPLNAVMVLRELGDVRTHGAMLAAFGVSPVRNRWLAEARKVPGMERTRDREVPGVQMQMMMIAGYGRDRNSRSIMLRSLGRMTRGPLKPAVVKELSRSLTWAGDPNMLVKAGEGISMAPYNKKLFQQLVKLSRRAASVMMAVFKKRQVKMFFWGKVIKGTCEENQKLETNFRECLADPPKLRGQPKNAIWRCFIRFQKYWTSEFLYAIKYHAPGDLKRLVQPRCRKYDSWWTGVRPGLLKKVKAGNKAARKKLYACEKKPSKKALATGTAVKCGEWTDCSRNNNTLCLDGHWQLRLRFHQHASLLALKKDARKLMAFRASDIMTPHGLKGSRLPRKGRSAFFDSDDALYLKHRIWSKKVERARLRRARAVLEGRLCQHRRFLRPVARCGADVACYAKVVRGALKLGWEDCKKLKAPYKRRTVGKRAPGWRAQVKGLRMLAHFGRLAGPRSVQARLALRTAIERYATARSLNRDAMVQMRGMILLVMDRVASYRHHKNLQCRHPYNKTKRMGCFKALKLVISHETDRRVSGVWQVNRDARNALGRLARRASIRYDTI